MSPDQSLVTRISSLLEVQPAVRIAIDGRCGSGKSTLAERLQSHFGCALVHMDDFYVPLTDKTPQRLSEPGGNVLHERFLAEVLASPPGAPFAYRPFLCRTQTLGPSVEVPAHRLLIIEGSYALHPSLRPYYDLTVFLTVSSELQLTRIRHRNGPEALPAFQTRWIPLEEAYFAALDIRSLCDIVIDTGDTNTTQDDGS